MSPVRQNPVKGLTLFEVFSSGLENSPTCIVFRGYEEDGLIYSRKGWSVERDEENQETEYRHRKMMQQMTEMSIEQPV
jgi:hypothetical protein